MRGSLPVADRLELLYSFGFPPLTVEGTRPLNQPRTSLPENQQNENHFLTNGALSKLQTVSPGGVTPMRVKSRDAG
jgi:hypothetical protein